MAALRLFPPSATLIVLVHLVATAYMTGVIWFVQIVHYPLMAGWPHDQFAVWEARHRELTGIVVIPGMVLEAVAVVLLLAFSPRGVSPWLIGAGALVGLGLFQLTPAVAMGEENWAMQLMAQLPELDWFPLMGLGAGCALVSPENLVFYVKEGSMLLTNHTGLQGDLTVGAVFVAVTTSLLLLPPLAWMLSRGQLRDPLTRLNDWLVHRAEWLVGVFALLLGVYLGWQGIEGLHQMALISLSPI